LTDPFQQVTCNPYLVTGFLSSFSKYLELPLAGGNLGVNTFNVQTSIQTSIQVLFNYLAAISIFGAYRAIVRALRAGITTCGKAQRLIGFGVPKKILLLKTKPKIIVIILDS